MEGVCLNTTKHDKATYYKLNSLSLAGAGIFVLTGQIAELAGESFPLVFLATVIVFDAIILSAFLFIKVSSNIFIIYASAVGVLIIFSGEILFLRGRS